MAHPIAEPCDQHIVLEGAAGAEEIMLLKRSTGDEVFVIWHGITANPRLWFWDILWERGEVWLAGLPGHGPVRPRPPAHYWRWSAEHFIDIAEQLAQLFAGRKLTLIGHSTGGMVALGVALRRPELVQRLILISSVTWGEYGGILGVWQKFAPIPALLHQVVKASLTGGRRSLALFRWSLLSFIRERQGFYSNPHVDQAIHMGYEHYQQTPLHSISGTVRVLHYADMRPAVQRAPYHGPTLLIHGSDDQIVPLKQSIWLQQHLPQAYLATMPQIGHMPFGEREPLFNRWVLDWLEQHPL